jgi:hypothetical protein
VFRTRCPRCAVVAELRAPDPGAVCPECGGSPWGLLRSGRGVEVASAGVGPEQVPSLLREALVRLGADVDLELEESRCLAFSFWRLGTRAEPAVARGLPELPTLEPAPPAGELLEGVELLPPTLPPPEPAASCLLLPFHDVVFRTGGRPYHVLLDAWAGERLVMDVLPPRRARSLALRLGAVLLSAGVYLGAAALLGPLKAFLVGALATPPLFILTAAALNRKEP